MDGASSPKRSPIATVTIIVLALVASSSLAGCAYLYNQQREQSEAWAKERETLSSRIDELGQSLSDRIDANGRRIDRVLWGLVATFTAITVNLVATLIR